MAVWHRRWSRTQRSHGDNCAITVSAFCVSSVSYKGGLKQFNKCYLKCYLKKGAHCGSIIAECTVYRYEGYSDTPPRVQVSQSAPALVSAKRSRCLWVEARGRTRTARSCPAVDKQCCYCCIGARASTVSTRGAVLARPRQMPFLLTEQTENTNAHGGQKDMASSCVRARARKRHAHYQRLRTTIGPFKPPFAAALIRSTALHHIRTRTCAN